MTRERECMCVCVCVCVRACACVSARACVYRAWKRARFLVFALLAAGVCQPGAIFVFRDNHSRGLKAAQKSMKIWIKDYKYTAAAPTVYYGNHSIINRNSQQAYQFQADESSRISPQHFQTQRKRNIRRWEGGGSGGRVRGWFRHLFFRSPPLLSSPLSSLLSSRLFSTRASSVKQWAVGASEIPRESCVPQTGRTGAGATPWKPVLPSRTSRTILRPTQDSDFSLFDSSQSNMVFAFSFSHAN